MTAACPFHQLRIPDLFHNIHERTQSILEDGDQKDTPVVKEKRTYRHRNETIVIGQEAEGPDVVVCRHLPQAVEDLELFDGVESGAGLRVAHCRRPPTSTHALLPSLHHFAGRPHVAAAEVDGE